MRRRDFIAGLSIATAAAPLSARAQGERVRRIGFLANDPAIPTTPAGQAFVDELRARGFVATKNLTIDWQFAESAPSRYPGLVAEILKHEPELIVASSPLSVAAARVGAGKTPIVMVQVSDPIKLGFVKSLAAPGGNITGVSSDASYEIDAKRLELLQQALGRVSRVALLTSPDQAVDQGRMKLLEAEARSLNIALDIVAVKRADDLGLAFDRMRRDRPDALITAANSLNFVNRRTITALASENRLPVMSNFKETTEAGGLMSYGADRVDTFRLAAVYVAKILGGAKPAELPVEQPTKFVLVINLKTAQTLGLTLPDPLLHLADEVIE